MRLYQRIRTVGFVLMLSSALACLCVSAQARRALTGGIGMSTLGPQLFAGIHVNDHLGLMLSAGYMKYNFSTTVDEVSYALKPHWEDLGLVTQWHPFAGYFHADVGVYYNNIHLNASPDSVEKMPGFKDIPTRYNALLQGADFDAKVSFNPVCPYVGIGWGRNSQSGFGVAFDLGVLYQGAPRYDFDYNAQLMAAVKAYRLATNQDVLPVAEKSLEDAVNQHVGKWLHWFPVVSLSLLYSS